ncbi:MAG: Fe-S-containing hydro-lyase [Eubacteriales bacterium]|nr:Fe-S-containing hydro-lyase [Eubacteriales bacterium]
MQKKIETPIDQDTVKRLSTGDSVLLSGIVFIARDAAHKKIAEMLDRGEPLPIDIRGQVIYYAGPCPAKPGQVIGSCGPTTSGRMDAYAPRLIKLGLAGMIGKGTRNTEVIASMKDHGAVYFCAVGGTGALLAKCIVSQEVIAFPELGTEALRKAEIKDFPVIVAIDGRGNDIYETGRLRYKKTVCDA